MKKITRITFALLSFFIFSGVVHADYTITTTSGTTPTDVFGTNNGPNAQDDYAQGFTTTGAGTVSQVTVMLQVNGGPNSVTLSIQGNSGGFPDGTPIDGGAATFIPSDFSGSCTEATFTFSTPISLAAATNYFLTFTTTAGVNTYPLNAWVVCGTSPEDSGNAGVLFLNSSWNNQNETERVIIPVVTSGPPPPGPGGFDGIINAASTHFASTTGFGIADAVTYMDINLIRLFMGSGLAVLYYLRYWIAVLIIIGSVIWFSFRIIKRLTN